MMRVLMLNYEYPPLGGGAANATQSILGEMAKFKDLEIRLVTSSTGPARSENPWPKVHVDFLDIGKGGNWHYQTNADLLKYSWKAWQHARKIRKRESFDLCHAFFGIPCGVIARRLGLPYIVSLRGSDVPFYNPRFRTADRLLFARLSRWVWKGARHVVTNSEGLRQLALNTAPDQQIGMIPNGVDTELFHPAQESKTGGPLRVLCVSRLVGRKRIDLLIEALAAIGKSQWRLEIVGRGNQEAELRARAREKGVADCVEFTGFRDHDDLPEIYRQADLFVLPSENEGMSNTVLEAMASGLAVIMGRTGGSDELIDAGQTGFIFDAYTPESLRKEIERYIKNPTMLKEHGRAGRSKACLLSWEAVAESYLRLYHDAGDTELRVRRP
ncbi:MAG: glycosyltransferase family 4 protein [Candidatus Sumerlaeia bacterium]